MVMRCFNCGCGSRYNWWELSVQSGSASNVCYVYSDGVASGDSAAYASVCAPLCFRIG